MSFSQFSRDDNVYFLFTINKCLVKSQVSIVVLLEVHVRSDDLYKFPLIAMPNLAKSTLFPSSFVVDKVVPNVYSISVYANLPNMWHLRLGNPNVRVLKLMLQIYNGVVERNIDT